MPVTRFQAQIPPADLPFFNSQSIGALKTLLDNQNIAYDPGALKYELYYRLILSGNRLPNMPAAHVPTLPPVPVNPPGDIRAFAWPHRAVPFPPAAPPPVPPGPIPPIVIPPLPAPPALTLTAIRNVVNIATVVPPAPPAPPAQRAPSPETPVTPGPPVPDSRVLYEVETIDGPIIFNQVAGASLKVKMMAWAPGIGPPGGTSFDSLMGYQCDIQFRPGDANNDDWEDIGHIVAWGFSRRTARNPNADMLPFYDDWLAGAATEFKYPHGTLCIAQALRAIYVNTPLLSRGIVRALVASADPILRQQLANDGTGDDIIYIQVLYVKHIRDRAADGTDLPAPHQLYAGHGFGARALQMFYRLLQGGILGTWYGINGPVIYILQPGLLNGEGENIAEMRTKWEQSRLPLETDVQLANRVQAELLTYYTSARRGYVMARPADASVGFDTLARHVPLGMFPKQPADMRQIDALAAGRGGRGGRGRGRINKTTATPTPRQNRRAPMRSQDDSDIPSTPTPSGAGRGRIVRGGRGRGGRARRSNSFAADGSP